VRKRSNTHTPRQARALAAWTGRAVPTGALATRNTTAGKCCPLTASRGQDQSQLIVANLQYESAGVRAAGGPTPGRPRGGVGAVRPRAVYEPRDHRSSQRPAGRYIAGVLDPCQQPRVRRFTDEAARPAADLHTGPALQGSLGHSANRVWRERGMVFDVAKGPRLNQ
jgi:hypothetical protein